MSLSSIWTEILAERARQDDQWGGPDHDDQHSQSDWAAFIERQLVMYSDADEFQRRLVRVAALAVAGLQSADRKRSAQASIEPLPMPGDPGSGLYPGARPAPASVEMVAAKESPKPCQFKECGRTDTRKTQCCFEWMCPDHFEGRKHDCIPF